MNVISSAEAGRDLYTISNIIVIKGNVLCDDSKLSNDAMRLVPVKSGPDISVSMDNPIRLLSGPM